MKKIVLACLWLGAVAGDAWACAFVEPARSNPYSLFNPDVCGRKEYGIFYKGYLDAYELTLSLNEFISRSNAEDWKKRTRYPGSIEEIIDGLENTQDRDLYAVNMYLEGNATTAPNPFINHLIQTGNRAALEYLSLAKQCEPHVHRVFSWYDDNPAPQPDKAAMRRLAESAVRGMENYPEYKDRFLFQAVRLLQYSGESLEALRLLEKHPVAENSAIYPRLMRHKAGLLIKTGRVAEGYGIIADLFAVPGWNLAAFIDFRPTEEAFRQTVSSGKLSPAALAWTYTLHGLKNGYSPNLDDLEAIRRIDSQFPGLNVLLAAEVRRMEGALMSYRLERSFGIRFAAGAAGPVADQQPTWWERLWRAIVRFFRSLFGKTEVKDTSAPNALYTDDEYYADYLANLDLLRNFVAQLPGEGFARVAEQYLSFLAGDFSAAQKTVDGEENIAAQSRLIAAVAALNEAKTADILKLSGLLADNNAIHNTACGLLGQMYFNAGDKTTAFILFAQSEFAKEAAVVAEMFMTDEELKKTAEALQDPKVAGVGFARLRYQPEDLTLSLGIRKMRQGLFDEAVTIFETLPEETWKQDYVFNEIMHASYPIKPYLEFSSSPVQNPLQPIAADLKTYNKLSFAREAAGLWSAAQSSPERAGLFYMRLGNLFYHSPYWGYNENLWNGEWLSVSRYLGSFFPLSGKDVYTTMQEKLKTYMNEYGSRKMAEKFYLMAADASQDPETAATALILAHQCSQTGLTSLHSNWGKPDTLTPYVSRLSQEFSHTAAYRNLIHTCPELAKFLKISA